MHKIDTYSYHCGVMDAFSEMVSAGVKKLALSHPFSTKEEALRYQKAVASICEKYHIYSLLEEELLITALFPASANEGFCVYLLYKEEATIQEYQQLKMRKQKLRTEHRYTKEESIALALAMGKLLSYDDESCQKKIAENI